MCRVLGVSTSGYYAWCKRGASRRATSDEALTATIIEIHKDSYRTYGAPRVQVELRKRNIRVARKRVARLMKQAGIQGVSRRRFIPPTTIRDPEAERIQDLVERDFTATAPDTLWIADLTYVKTGSGTLYLAIVVDVWSRRIVGWAMESHHRSELVERALKMAVERRQPRDVIHHSDQGSEYTSYSFRKLCERAGIRQSTGSVGDCYDNAMCESVFATIECELLWQNRFQTHEDARRAIFHYMEGWYNPRRMQSALGYLSPVEFESYHCHQSQ